MPEKMFLDFMAGNRKFRIDTSFVLKIIYPENIVPVPNAFGNITGAVYSDGAMLALFSLDEKGVLQSTEHRIVLIVNCGEKRIAGIIADKIFEKSTLLSTARDDAGTIEVDPEKLLLNFKSQTEKAA